MKTSLKKHLKIYSPKSGFTIIEVSVVFLLILGVTFWVVPKTLNSTKQAKLISKWSQTYSEIEYTFSAIKAQLNGSIFSPKNDLLTVIKPYLRITTKLDTPYQQYYMNKKEVKSTSIDHFDSFYLTSSNEIIGLKLINQKCDKEQICASVSYDVNGILLPNTWGYDVFGINVYKDKIEPMGKNVEQDILKYDCSKIGSGVDCSYYYLIGGRFD